MHFQNVANDMDSLLNRWPIESILAVFFQTIKIGPMAIKLWISKSPFSTDFLWDFDIKNKFELEYSLKMKNIKKKLKDT